MLNTRILDGINKEEEELNMNKVRRIQGARAKNITSSFVKTISKRWCA